MTTRQTSDLLIEESSAVAHQPPTTLITVTLPPGSTLQDAMRRLGIASGEVDEEYGLVLVDPEQQSYALLVTEEAGARLQGARGGHGPHANPRMEPFGPPSPPGQDRSPDDRDDGGA
ncbi:hypothetical protein LHJ74_13640 [Streptomyces sp. N2-109]|uniref:Uncharacterized protein n=1 Tax=Streptomyces gossypii TaxID=2883101 RepID=A0ABT2JSS0_9ACTN|nr:hypothetical protein [Streptomyces gossypii]MCT2590939.1 hypothetical protein [Streptomyces gossypii]